MTMASKRPYRTGTEIKLNNKTYKVTHCIKCVDTEIWYLVSLVETL